MSEIKKISEGRGKDFDFDCTQISESFKLASGISKLRELVDLARYDRKRARILADWLSERNFTIKETREDLIAVANSTGTEKIVSDFFDDILDEKERQIQN
jgi:hypothetical protein